MIEVEFNNANYDVITQSWENWLEMPSYIGNLIEYDEKMGKGLLFIVELEKGLIITTSDYTANDDLVFVNKAYSSDNNAVFSLDYLVMGDVSIVQDKQEGKKHNMLNKVVSHHSKSNFSFLAPKGKRARVLDVIFSHEWLLNQFNPSQRKEITERISEIENRQNFYIDAVSRLSLECVKEILDGVFYEQWNNVFLKRRILFLVEEFVKNNIFLKMDVMERLAGNETLSAMLEIKKRLDTTLYEKLPTRKLLAKEFLMSESTLDRHFKHSFGKTIMEYHLEQKMELSKRILKRNEYTISQIAYLLGYETASAFIKSFKKHFGVSPGLAKKNID